MTDVIKVRYLKQGQPQGREYTYKSPVEVKVGDIVGVSVAQGVVTAVDVPEDEIKRFGDNAKTILGKYDPERGVVPIE